ncbi:MAG: type I restriction-modification system subunit M [Phycisphaerales bacterium]|nr:type I restriction-modification system subunit M [Phycisphaerales bacterium]
MDQPMNFNDKVAFIWSVADLLRGPYRPNQYGKVILPLTVLRRLDCLLEPTRKKVLEKQEELKRKGMSPQAIEPILNRTAAPSDWPKDRPFLVHNTSRFDFQRLKEDPNHIARNLAQYIKGFSSEVRRIFEHFGFAEHIEKLDKANRLYLVVSRFADIDLHPGAVTNTEMGYIFEELIRKFSEAANETAGDHFTPREVIRLMVNLLFEEDGEALTKKGIVRTLFDPACGTGGMLSVAEEYLAELNPDAKLEVFGQDYNDESYAICGSDMLIKGQNIEHIVFGDSFTEDGFPGERFDYMLANPPFGVEWKPEEDIIRQEHDRKGGRFDAGVPRINDGSLLFLQHMISKMKPIDPKKPNGGSRIGIVFNGSPLFTGDAGSGESNIRRWIIESDWLEAIIALPDQLFYNTGIFTYIWIVTNRKAPARRGKVQLINAVHFYRKMRKSLGNKRNEIADNQIAEITRLYGECRHDDARELEIDGERQRAVVSKIFENEDFGFRKVTIEQPLRLKFQALLERIDALREATPFQNLAKSKKKRGTKAAQAEEEAGRAQQEAVLKVLRSFDRDRVWMSRHEFLADLEMAAAEAEVKLPAPIKKAIVSALGERDESAEVCRDKDGSPEPDPELRDYENVPLKQDVYDYFEREVKPHVPDAWINEGVVDEQDGKVGKVGYEIPLNRHFYVYKPPRPLEKIEVDIASLEKDIVRMLAEVTR